MRHYHTIQPADPDRVNLVQITDTHIQARPDELFDGVDTAATLSRVVTAITRLDPAPDAVLLTGDLVHEPEEAAYERLLERLGPVGRPVFCLPGNHDDPGLMRSCMNQGEVHTAAGLSLGPWRVLLLNTWLPASHAGRLSRAELRDLRLELNRLREDYVLIALHHPPVSVASPWMDAMGLQDRQEFLTLIDAHPAVRAVIWGHIHQEYEQRRGETLFLGTPSTCIQFKPGADRYIPDERPPAYRQLILNTDGSVTTRLEYVAASTDCR